MSSWVNERWLARLGLGESQAGILTVGATATLATLGLAAYFFNRSKPAIKHAISLDNQSREIEPGVRVSHKVPNNNALPTYYFEDATTTHEAFERGLKVSENGPCLGKRSGPNKEYEWINYKQVYDRAQNLGSGLQKMGLSPNNDTFVGIYASNSIEWVVSKQACWMYSMVVVPLYDTLGTEACSYIINQTSMSTVLCDSSKKVDILLGGVEQTNTLKLIVLFDSVDTVSSQSMDLAKKHNIQVMSIADVEKLGSENLKNIVPPEPEDVCTICYTSGTTGNPKGVVLTHQNLISNVGSVMYFPELKFSSQDIHISYLPLAHMFEQIVQTGIFMFGAQIGFFGGDVRNLLEDIGTLKPTIFVTVPRLLNRIYDKVIQGTSASLIKSVLFRLAYSRKRAMLARGIVTQNSIWDTLVFRRIQNMLGGRVRFVLTGSAPLSGNVLDFVRCAFGCLVVEGYGQTECTAGCTMTLPYETQAGHVGAPLPCNMVKLIDVPEMDYYVKNNKGEVCMKGPAVMKGYYKDPERTREALDDDGWVHSGDVGMWLPNGTLKIIDRRKHIFKLAQGEYLAPEKIEGVYLRSQLVAQAFVDGSSLETFAVGVIVPDPDVLPNWAQKWGVSGSMEELCRNKVVKEEILKDVRKVGQEAGLKGFEQVKDIYLQPELFSLENGLLTPTFKSKRPALRKYFSSHIEDMYQKAKS